MEREAWDTNRTVNQRPRRGGKVWCGACDRAEVEPGHRCAACGNRYRRPGFRANRRNFRHPPAT